MDRIRITIPSVGFSDNPLPPDPHSPIIFFNPLNQFPMYDFRVTLTRITIHVPERISDPGGSLDGNNMACREATLKSQKPKVLCVIA